MDRVPRLAALPVTLPASDRSQRVDTSAITPVTGNVDTAHTRWISRLELRAGLKVTWVKLYPQGLMHVMANARHSSALAWLRETLNALELRCPAEGPDSSTPPEDARFAAIGYIDANCRAISRSDQRPGTGRVSEPSRMTSGFLVLRTGKRPKSRSADQSSRTPCWRHSAAIRAS